MPSGGVRVIGQTVGMVRPAQLVVASEPWIWRRYGAQVRVAVRHGSSAEAQEPPHSMIALSPAQARAVAAHLELLADRVDAHFAQRKRRAERARARRKSNREEGS
jgi:hypothetical protein